MCGLEWICVCACFLGHGILPDAVRARGGNSVQAGAREEGHHQGNMVGEASGNYRTWYMDTHNHVHNCKWNVKQMLERLLLLMGNIQARHTNMMRCTPVSQWLGLLCCIAPMYCYLDIWKYFERHLKSGIFTPWENQWWWYMFHMQQKLPIFQLICLKFIDTTLSFYQYNHSLLTCSIFPNQENIAFF